MEYIKVTCVLVSSSVCAVDVVGLVNWDSVGRGMVDWSMLNRGMVDRGVVDRNMLNRGRDMVDRDVLDRSVVSRDGVGWLVVDGGSVGRLLMMVVGTRVLRGGGASLVRPRVVWEPG